MSGPGCDPVEMLTLVELREHIRIIPAPPMDAEECFCVDLVLTLWKGSTSLDTRFRVIKIETVRMDAAEWWPSLLAAVPSARHVFGEGTLNALRVSQADAAMMILFLSR